MFLVFSKYVQMENQFPSFFFCFCMLFKHWKHKKSLTSIKTEITQRKNVNVSKKVNTNIQHKQCKVSMNE